MVLPEPMVFIATRASVKPRILSNHSAGAPSPIRPVALAAAARSGSAFTSSLIFSNWPWSSSSCKSCVNHQMPLFILLRKFRPAAILASARRGMFEAKLIQHAGYHMVDNVIYRFGMVIKAGIGGTIATPMRESASIFSRWMVLSGISRGTSTSLRPSLSTTSAARPTVPSA